MLMLHTVRRRDVFNPLLTFRDAVRVRPVSRLWAFLHPDQSLSIRRTR